MIKPEEIKSIVATDCGSTTTKAILIEKKEDGYRLIVREKPLLQLKLLLKMLQEVC